VIPAPGRRLHVVGTPVNRRLVRSEAALRRRAVAAGREQVEFAALEQRVIAAPQSRNTARQQALGHSKPGVCSIAPATKQEWQK
jgi:hypothetical protein